MIEIFLLITELLLLILGISELLHSVKLWLLYSEKSGNSYSVICLKSLSAEQQMRFAVAQRKWLGKKYADNIIAINSFISGEEYYSCEQFAKKYGIIYCSIEQLDSVLLYFNERRM